MWKKGKYLGPVINIAKCKIDERGRITLPDTLLKANGIERGTYVLLQPMSNNCACRLEFKYDEEDSNNL